MLKLNVGFSRKVGESHYGSRGASVNLELELESSLAGEPETLRDRVKHLFRMARDAVNEELKNGEAHPGNGSTNGVKHRPASNGHASRSNGRSATANQVRAIRAIANRQKLDLPAELRDRFGVERPDDLSLGQASELIDAIKPQTSNGSR